MNEKKQLKLKLSNNDTKIIPKKVIKILKKKHKLNQE